MNQLELADITKILLKKLRIPISRFVISRDLEFRADYPSLLSLKNALNRWKIRNIIVTLDVKQLDDISYPCLSVIENNYCLLVSKSDNVITYQNDYGKEFTVTLSDFEKKWNNIVVIIDSKNYSINKSNYDPRTGILQKWFLLLVIILSAILFMAVFSTKSEVLLIEYCLQLFGVLIARALLQAQISGKNSRFCEIGNKINCDSILNSAVSTILGIKLSVIVFFYFTSLTIVIFLLSVVGNSAFSLGLLFIVSVLSFPFTILSIYYQARVARVWCPLCLIVVITIWLNGLLSYASFSFVILREIDAQTLTLVSWAFLMAFAITFLESGNLNYRNQSMYDSKCIQRLKTDRTVLEALLEKNKYFNDWDFPNTIVYGNRNAINIITLIINVNCSTCQDSYWQIKKLVDESPKLVSLRCALVGGNDISRHLLSLAKTGDFFSALELWFLTKDFENVKNKYLLSISNLDSVSTEICDAFCKKHSINFIPAIFLNGSRVPEIMEIDDLAEYLFTISIKQSD